MPSTPLIACSSGVVTAVSTVLRARAGVERGDLDLRRRELRILRDRQRRDGEGARQDDDERADGRQDRPSDEGVDEHGSDARGLAIGADRRAVADLLNAGDDQGVTGLEPAAHDVVVAEHLADLNRLLFRDQSALWPRFGDKTEVLAADAHDRSQRHGQPLDAAPHDARPDELQDTHRWGHVAQQALDEHGLGAVVHARGDEADGVAGDDLAVVIEQLDRQSEAELRRSVERHLDVRFERLPVVDGRNHR